MGYTLLYTLSELWFTQFCNFCFALHLPAFEQCVFFCFSTAFVLEKKQSGFLKVLPWVVVGAGGLGAGKTSGAGTRGVSLDVVIGVGTGYTNTKGGESSDNRGKVHADCGPAENPSL